MFFKKTAKIKHWEKKKEFDKIIDSLATNDKEILDLATQLLINNINLSYNLTNQSDH